MDHELIDILYTWAYLLLWIGTLVWYHHRVRTLDGGTVAIVLFIIYNSFAVASYTDELFSLTYKPVTLLPYIFLYGMIMLSMWPLVWHHNHPTQSIEPQDNTIFKLIALMFVGCTILMLPDIISNFGDGLVKLFLDSEAGKDAYEEKMRESGDTGGTINNLVSVIYNSFNDCAIFLCFYFLSLGRKYIWYVIALLSCIIIGFLSSVSEGERGAIVMGLCTMIGCYMFFRQYLSKRINRALSYCGSVAAIALLLPVVALTLSRHGDVKTASVGSYISWYVGQGSLYFNNYAFDSGGTRDGERTINLFLRLVKDDVPTNYMECRQKHSSMNISDHLFTTYVGDFVFDFGPLLAIIIFVVAALVVMSQIRTRGDTIKVHQLLLLYFNLCIILQGGMCLFSFAFTANLRIIVIAMLYGYLRCHEYLLANYSTSNETTIQTNC